MPAHASQEPHASHIQRQSPMHSPAPTGTHGIGQGPASVGSTHVLCFENQQKSAGKRRKDIGQGTQRAQLPAQRGRIPCDGRIQWSWGDGRGTADPHLWILGIHIHIDMPGIMLTRRLYRCRFRPRCVVPRPGCLIGLCARRIVRVRIRWRLARRVAGSCPALVRFH